MWKLLYFLRWGHWPKKMRYPNGIPRVETYRASDPFWHQTADGSVLHLDDGGTITFTGPDRIRAAIERDRGGPPPPPPVQGWA